MKTHCSLPAPSTLAPCSSSAVARGLAPRKMVPTVSVATTWGCRVNVKEKLKGVLDCSPSTHAPAYVCAFVCVTGGGGGRVRDRETHTYPNYFYTDKADQNNAF